MKSQKLAIITGITSGIGFEIGRVLHDAGYVLHGIARDPKKLTKLPYELHSSEICDFSKDTTEHLLEGLDFSDWNEIVLINNAGTLDPIAPLLKISEDELKRAFQVNFYSIVFLSKRFYQKLLAEKNPKRAARIVNISTGAAFNGYAGWTAYCSSKAALWLQTQCFAQEMDKSICQIVSLAPGIVETNMQVQIREQDKKDFPLVDMFRDLKNQGKTFSADVPAKYLLKLLARDPFPHGQHLDLRKD